MHALSARRLRVIDSIVARLVPPLARLEGANARRVQDDVNAYVAGQVAAMPAHLRFAYELALTLFDGLALLRHGSRFAELDASRASRYLAAWSQAPLAPMRDFVKLVRSCALLAYFDHPEVRPRLAGPGSANPAFAKDGA